MGKAKVWYTSKTIIAAIVAMVMFVAKIFGWDVDEGLITEAIVNLFGFIAIIVVIYGRVKAVQKIK